VSLLRIDRYRLLRQLGSGASASVYLAEDTLLKRKVAVKLLHRAFTRDPEQLQRFRSEAEWMSMLSHPNLLTLFEVGESEGNHYIVSEYVEGETLRVRLNRGALPLRKALEIASSIAAALKVAHEAWVVHRDLKPENVMIHREGYVKVLDFGVAKLTDPSGSAQHLTRPGMVLGTLQYLAPEQLRAEAVDPRTDLWALGVILHEMIVGKGPFHASAIPALFDGILNGEPAGVGALAPEAPPELDQLIIRALRKDPEERFQSAGEMLLALGECRDELTFRERSRRQQV
jgi:eukaryotic-like serine/threonine-protein kinase